MQAAWISVRTWRRIRRRRSTRERRKQQPPLGGFELDHSRVSDVTLVGGLVAVVILFVVLAQSLNAKVAQQTFQRSARVSVFCGCRTPSCHLPRLETLPLAHDWETELTFSALRGC